jgi:signal transduction histidine kinase
MLPDRVQDPEYCELLTRLVPAEVGRIVALAERLRALAPGNRESHRLVDLGVVLTDSVALPRIGSLGQRDIKVVLETEDRLPLVQGDTDTLTQLFGNLLQNAVDASPNGSCVRIFVRRADGSVRVEIIDEGTGIPGDVRARLFEPFVTTKRSGIGLGLSICREIADAHRADLRFESGPGGIGTTAIIMFPA